MTPVGEEKDHHCHAENAWKVDERMAYKLASKWCTRDTVTVSNFYKVKGTASIKMRKIDHSQIRETSFTCSLVVNLVNEYKKVAYK